MKVLLLVPPTDLTKSYGRLKSFSNPQPSIGIAYIASVLRENAYDVRIADAYVNEYTLNQIMRILGEYFPDVVGISVLTASAEVVYEISSNIRDILPETKIVMGNVHASLFSDEILSMNYADFVVHREGELTTLELVKALENGANFDGVKGLSFKRNGQIINNPSRPYIENLDMLPFPAWDLFPLNKYSTDPRTEVKKGFVERQILASRGCPFQCSFCSSRTERSQGNKYRTRNPKSVVDEMVYMHQKYGSQVFSFMDLAFPLIRQHAIDFCNELINRELNKKFKWMTECRVKPLDEELLALMKKAGCVRVCFGIESGNDKILRLLKKNFTKEDVKSAIEMARKAGLVIDGMFMIGLPEEDEALIKETIDFAIAIDIRFAIFNIFVPYPGCELYEILSKQNKIKFKKWSDFTSYPTYSGGRPVYIPDALTHEKLMELQKHAMRRFYSRPRFFFDQIIHFKPHQLSKYWAGLRGVFLQK